MTNKASAAFWQVGDDLKTTAPESSLKAASVAEGRLSSLLITHFCVFQDSPYYTIPLLGWEHSPLFCPAAAG
jgi:hypothetical protein